MQIDQGDFLLTEAELYAALNSLGLTPNDLGLQPPSLEGQEIAADIYGTLDASLRSKFKEAMTTLTVPAKMAQFHYTVADESISRSILAWPPDEGDTIVAVVRTGANRRVSIRSESDMGLLIAKLLGANDSLREEGISLLLSTEGILVFLAIVEHLRLVRYHSIQTHTEPVNIFNQEEVLARLADASTEDFRWPLLFVEKVMPVSITAALSPEDVARAIEELILVGLVDSVDETGVVQVYELAEAGVRIADSIVHEVSKVALGISAFREDDEIGHEVMLLVRSSFDLFLFDLAGQQGVVASLSAEALNQLMKHVLSRPSFAPPEMPAPEETKAEVPPLPVTPAVRHCANCGAPIDEGAKFCSQCAASVAPSPAAGPKRAAKICPRCGYKNRAGFELCVQCGTALPAWPASESPSKKAATLCPRCGYANEPGKRFCTQCGAPL